LIKRAINLKADHKQLQRNSTKNTADAANEKRWNHRDIQATRCRKIPDIEMTVPCAQVTNLWHFISQKRKCYKAFLPSAQFFCQFLNSAKRIKINTLQKAFF